MTNGTYLLIALIAISFALWPERTANTLTEISLKIQIYHLNSRMKWAAWWMHRTLTKHCEEAGFPAPGPFRFTNLWDRES